MSVGEYIPDTHHSNIVLLGAGETSVNGWFVPAQYGLALDEGYGIQDR
jgi:hypothetical protein